MNIQVTHLSFAFLVLLLSSSCSPGGETDGNTLPDGKYPLAFTSSVEAMAETRAATADGTWTEGDQIAVKVGEEVKEYSYGDGATFTVASGDPFYWTSAEETKSVSAWYCGDGSTATGETHAKAIPTTWSVKSNQNADNGYQQSDILYAPAKEITFRDEQKSLDFYHQTACVVINIKNAEAATDAGSIRSVVIGDAGNLALSGSYTAPTGTGVTAGTWDTSSGSPTMGTIIPKKLAAPHTLIGGETALASYAALVIPQQMKDKKFIAVTLTDDNTYYYTPTQDNDADLQGSKQHTYDITVKHGYLSVTSSASPQWTGSGETINGKEKNNNP